ncbi:MAG TPA: ATP-binding protein [Xanthomonadales bacterium]|nr:ATP-binding protein [Xanthomonadales bacterium]
MQLQLDLRNDFASLEDAVASLEKRLIEHAVPRPVVDDARLIAEEVLANAIRHGMIQHEVHSLAIRAERDDARLRLEFLDDGAAYNPLVAPVPAIDAPIEQRPVGGLGVFLVCEVAESVRYERRDGRNVLHVVLRIH